ncbi:hypothetical protein T4E_81 [Trichinella pseudospiralis]|uniref:Uncharacterized protein n=1 Tax=Trichinella pseudospiralis TaxID=6337 RepID=A0A0V0XJG9_TRIPS|nr:hypothetical protein T4E_81 [Trichinella pseudospiralis]
MANMPGVEPVLKVDRRWRDQIESYRAARSSIPLDKIDSGVSQFTVTATVSVMWCVGACERSVV